MIGKEILKLLKFDFEDFAFRLASELVLLPGVEKEVGQHDQTQYFYHKFF